VQFAVHGAKGRVSSLPFPNLPFVIVEQGNEALRRLLLPTLIWIV
jgi:hypothetical protein